MHFFYTHGRTPCSSEPHSLSYIPGTHGKKIVYSHCVKQYDNTNDNIAIRPFRLPHVGNRVLMRLSYIDCLGHFLFYPQ